MKAVRHILYAMVLLQGYLGSGQYFGKNKPHYEQFEFNVYQTPHFEIYEYLNNPQFRQELSENTERWYQMHQRILKDTFDVHNPMIVYSNHADFQQTTAISGYIGEGTGGVTESLKNRVIFPILYSNQKTGHVLGHELVHAFQYHIVKTFNTEEQQRKEKNKEKWFDDMRKLQDQRSKAETREEKQRLKEKIDSLNNLEPDTVFTPISFNNLPLWIVEGMAEYLSIGRFDPMTAMWMRDAVANDRLPTIKDLNNYSKYFPYRWGQAYWAFIVGNFGEGMMPKLFIETGQYGVEDAIKRNFGMDQEKFSELWIRHLKDYYSSLLQDFESDSLNHSILLGDAEKSSDVYVGPAISPNGQYFVYTSERDMFSLELYLGNAKTGELLQRITSVNRNDHLDAVASIETNATWAPDNERIAYTAFDKGQNVLVVQNIFSKGEKKQYKLKGVPAFTTPAWSPNGRFIIVSGLVNGQIDLYAFELETEEVHQLTDDKYSETMPAWSPDGNRVVYSTDRNAFAQGKTYGNLNYDLEILELESGKTTPADPFDHSNQLNPLFAPDGTGVWFLSDQDGFRDLYYHDLVENKTYRQSRLWTGITGITENAPAVSISSNGDVLYTVYNNNKYQIRSAPTGDFLREPVSATSNRSGAGVLPKDTMDVVSGRLALMQFEPLDSVAHYKTVPYETKFKLDFIGGSAGVGISNNTWGATSGTNGGVNMLFSDILGSQQLFVGAQLNGELLDFALQSSYVNQKGRLPWAVGVSHIPIRYGRMGYAGQEPIAVQDDTVLTQHFVFDQYRIFQDQVSSALFYPLSQTNRFELTGSVGYYYATLHRFHAYYAGNFPVKQEREKIPQGPGQFLSQTSLAFVHDHSKFGMTAPSTGARYRLEWGRYFGAYKFYTGIADYRKYLLVNPVTFAFRLTHFGNYGDTDNLRPTYIGNPNMVRGYSFNKLIDNFGHQYNFSLDQLIGSKVALGGAEIRFPMSGAERLALLSSKLWFSDLSLFFDSGVAWSTFGSPGEGENNTEQFAQVQSSTSGTPQLVSSVGLSYRVNLMGAIVIEPFYAIPLHPDFKAGFGLNISPGW